MGDGTDQSGRFTVDSIRYDLNGNITRVKRHGAAGLVDDLQYTYRANPGNQLLSVADTAPHADTAGYPKANPSTNAASPDTVFVYGPNGNRIADSTRGQYATYNYFNVPDAVELAAKGEIKWLYAAGGEKLRKRSQPEGGGHVTTHYAGGFVYESTSTTKDTTLRYTSFGQGRIVAEGDTSEEQGYSGLAYEYHLTDHLGNTRIAFEPSGDSLKITQRRAYYPYGIRWARPSTIAGATSRNEHLYNGKDLAEELGLNWYHYGARYYDVALARWVEMDPADEFHSPYTYVGNDPLNLTDPDGRQVTLPSVDLLKETADIVSAYLGNEQAQQRVASRMKIRIGGSAMIGLGAYAGPAAVLEGALAGGGTNLALNAGHQALNQYGSTGSVSFQAMNRRALAGDFLKGATFGAALGPAGGLSNGLRGLGTSLFAGGLGNMGGGLLDRGYRGEPTFEPGLMMRDFASGSVGAAPVTVIKPMPLPGSIFFEETAAFTTPKLYDAGQDILNNDVGQDLKENY